MNRRRLTDGMYLSSLMIWAELVLNLDDYENTVDRRDGHVWLNSVCRCSVVSMGCQRNWSSVQQVPINVEPASSSVFKPRSLVQNSFGVPGDVLHDAILVRGLALCDVDNCQSGPLQWHVLDDLGASPRMSGDP